MSGWGSYAPNLHEGGRSEYYAQLALSALGTSVPVPRQEDSGLDLYCTLTEGDSKRAWAQAYFVVQVKSDEAPWEIKHERSVNALVQVPLPLFLCVVQKKAQQLRIYHTSPRFYVWAFPPYPTQVRLHPGEPGNGVCTQWANEGEFDLSAPILDFSLQEIEEEEFREKTALILKYWIDVEQENLKLVRHGLRSFTMPDRYITNELPSGSRVSQFLRIVSKEDLKHAISSLRPPLDGVTQQLFHHDLPSAVRGMLLLRQLYWDDQHHPLALGFASNTLNDLLDKNQRSYKYEALDYLGNVMDLAILRGMGDRVGEHLSRVQRLYLTGKDVTDDDIKALRFARELKRLELFETGITDAGMKHLEGLSELRYVSLGGTGITDTGLQALSGLTELRVLYLDGTRITSGGMTHLKALTKLENLSLIDTQVDDEGLESLGRLPSLEVLFLNGTSATDGGLERLKPAPRLRRVDYQRTGITKEAYETWLRAMPGWVEYTRETEELIALQDARLARWNQSSRDAV